MTPTLSATGNARTSSLTLCAQGTDAPQVAGCARFGNNCGRNFGWQPIIFGAWGVSAPNVPDARYFVERLKAHNDAWMIKFDDEEYGPYKSQSEAVIFAIEAAEKLNGRGEKPRS